MATFLLVHGAFQGGWVWQKVAAMLRGQGHEVHAPTLSGCGYLSHGMQQEDDLLTYIEDIAQYIEFEDLQGIVLIAHSFSGMICGEVMMRFGNRIMQAIFVDAVIPEAHRTFAETAGEPFRNMLEKHRLGGGKVRPWPLQVFGVDKSSADWFEPRLRPFPYQAFLTPYPGHFAPDVLPCAFIGCRETISPFIRKMAEKAKGYTWQVLEIQAGHCPMVSCPEELVRAMMSILASDDGLQP